MKKTPRPQTLDELISLFKGIQNEANEILEDCLTEYAKCPGPIDATNARTVYYKIQEAAEEAIVSVADKVFYTLNEARIVPGKYYGKYGIPFSKNDVFYIHHEPFAEPWLLYDFEGCDTLHYFYTLKKNLTEPWFLKEIITPFSKKNKRLRHFLIEADAKMNPPIVKFDNDDDLPF